MKPWGSFLGDEGGPEYPIQPKGGGALLRSVITRFRPHPQFDIMAFFRPLSQGGSLDLTAHTGMRLTLPRPFGWSSGGRASLS